MVLLTKMWKINSNKEIIGDRRKVRVLWLILFLLQLMNSYFVFENWNMFILEFRQNVCNNKQILLSKSLWTFKFNAYVCMFDAWVYRKGYIGCILYRPIYHETNQILFYLIMLWTIWIIIKRILSMNIFLWCAVSIRS